MVENSHQGEWQKTSYPRTKRAANKMKCKSPFKAMRKSSRIQDTGLTIQEKATQRVSQKNLEGNPSCSKNAFAILNAVPNTYYYEIASKK